MPVLVAQVLIDDSSNKTITGQLDFDRTNGGILNAPAGSAFPGSPVAGEWFWRTDEAKLYRRNSGNTAWDAVTASDPSAAPATRAINTANGLQGGGDLTADRTLSPTYGTSANTVCQGNDARLSDSRTPTGAASGDLTGTYPSPTIAALAVTDAKVAAANKDGVAGTPSMRTLGTGAAQACAGNDSRLSDDRTASGLRTASTVVSVSGATAPTAGQVLTATGASAATWQTPGAAASILVETASADISANTTTTSTSFVDLLTVNITTGAGFLCIFANGAVSNASANVNMRLRVLVDGVSIGGMQMRSPATNIGMAFSFNKRVAVAAGARVVKLQWATVSGTMQCRPVANPDAESASLLVQEVTA